MLLNHKIILFLLICIVPLIIQASEEPSEYLQEEITERTISDTDWDNLLEGIDYGAIKREKKNSPQNPPNLEFVEPLLKIIGILSVITILVFLLYRFAGTRGLSKSTNKSFNPEDTINVEQVAEHIHEFDMDELIKQAVLQGTYLKAVRLYYLKSIKTLSNNDLIQWKKDKTNRTYIEEISDYQLRKDFTFLTNVFERIWYGEAEISSVAFRQIEKNFQEFITQVQ